MSKGVCTTSSAVHVAGMGGIMISFAAGLSRDSCRTQSMSACTKYVLTLVAQKDICVCM